MMSEFELLQIVEASVAQIISIISQIIAINFAMMVAIYYFLNEARFGLKAASFLLYTLGSTMYLLLAVRQSTVTVAAMDALEALPAEARSDVTASLLAYAVSPASFAMNVAVNAAFWALWLTVLFLLFFWKKTGLKKKAS